MEELTGLDARFLYSETPASHMHTMKVAVVDVSGRREPLTPDGFTAQFEASLDRMPALRRRAVEIPHRISHPIWVEDPELDVSRHVHWRTASGPGGLVELAQIVAEIAAVPLDRNRPLWDLTVVEGLGLDQTAFVMKLHHSVADGGAAVAMLRNAFMNDDEQAVRQPARPEPIPSAGELYRLGIRSRARRLSRIPALARHTAKGVQAARRVDRELPERPARAFEAPRTSLNVSLVPGRTFAMLPLPMEDLLGVKRAHGTTLNDVFLTVCGGGLRRYLDRRGELPDQSLVASVPLATQTGQLRLSGNHTDSMNVALCTDIAGAVERLKAVHAASRAARLEREALGIELFEERASLTPPHLYSWTLRLWGRSHLANRTRPPVNLVASNVPGPRETLELEGGIVTALYSVGPILEGIGLNITAWSYRDTLNVSVLGCPASLPDPWILATDLEASLEELHQHVPIG